jgi:hypothetical protein
MSDFSELEDRLRAYGAKPVDSGVQSEHLTAIAQVATPPRRSSLAHKLRVAGALVAGLFIGSTGLAAAGALPDAAQDAAHGALARVGVNVPLGTERYQGAECGTPEGGGEWRNHGHYVRSQPEAEREAAGESDCGKPLNSVGKGEGDENEGAGEPNDCAASGQAIADAAKARNGKPENPGKPDHAGKPEQTGKPECTPEGGSEPEESGANDAVTEPETQSAPADPEAKPVETPVGPPDSSGEDTGDTQGVPAETPGAEEGNVPEETPPSETPGAEEGDVPEEDNVPEETPSSETEEDAPPED